MPAKILGWVVGDYGVFRNVMQVPVVSRRGTAIQDQASGGVDGGEIGVEGLTAGVQDPKLGDRNCYEVRDIGNDQADAIS